MDASATTTDVRLGFMPASHAIADPDHPGLLRAGPRASGPYGRESVEHHRCVATDGARDPNVRPHLTVDGFDLVDLTGIDDLQAALARVAAAGRIGDEDASAIRAALDGATLPCAGVGAAEVLFIADEGFIMRSAGPNGLSVVGPRSQGMNDHGGATSVHADQDVYGTPLAQLMDGRAPALFHHDSPDGSNHDAELLLVNLWIPLQQITQPLVLADTGTVDRRRHQLRYGLATEAFLERDDDQAINDIWTFLHDGGQRWHLRSEMDHRCAYLFNTLSMPHGAGTLPGEDLAERCFLALEAAEGAASAGDPAAVRSAVEPAVGVEAGPGVPPALAAAVADMVAVAERAHADPDGVCGDGAEPWVDEARRARDRVVRRSLELRLVVSLPD